MPAWVRTSIPRVSRQLSTTPIVLETDPSVVSEIAAADLQQDWINVEILGTPGLIEVYRSEGARTDNLVAIDAPGVPYISINASGTHRVSWPTGPAGAARKLRLECSASSGSPTMIVDVETVFRAEGS